MSPTKDKAIAAAATLPGPAALDAAYEAGFVAGAEAALNLACAADVKIEGRAQSSRESKGPAFGGRGETSITPASTAGPRADGHAQEKNNARCKIGEVADDGT